MYLTQVIVIIIYDNIISRSKLIFLFYYPFLRCNFMLFVLLSQMESKQHECSIFLQKQSTSKLIWVYFLLKLVGSGLGLSPNGIQLGNQTSLTLTADFTSFGAYTCTATNINGFVTAKGYISPSKFQYCNSIRICRGAIFVNFVDTCTLHG